MAQNDFLKSFILDDIVPESSTSKKTWELVNAEYGMFNKNTHALVDPAGDDTYFKANPYVYFAQASRYSVDKVGKATPLVGLTESVKSTGINAKYVTKFYKQVGVAAKQHVIQIGLETATPLAFEAATTYNLRIQAKGSPALRTIQRHLYRHIPSYTGCQTSDCLTGCEKEYVDPAKVIYDWAKYINEDPLVNMFVSAKAYKVAAKASYTNTADTSFTITALTGTVLAGQLVKGEGIALGTTVTNVNGSTITVSKATSAVGSATDIYFCTELTSSSSFQANSTTAFTAQTDKAFLILTAAYIDTQFGNCSFSIRDFYSVEPLVLDAALVNDSGEPCLTGPKISTNGFYSNPVEAASNAKELQKAVQPEGLGESVLRRYLVSREYEGIHFSSNPRIREVEKDPVFDVVDRTGVYNVYFLQYHVPTHVNPNNTMASNEYLISFSIKQADDNTDFADLVNGWLSANGSSVQLVTYTPQ